jgi:hypothetical protein
MGPRKSALGLCGRVPSCAQPCIQVQLSQRLETRFTRRAFMWPQGRRFSNRRNFNGRRHDRRLAGVELNFFVPFALGLDPDRHRRADLWAIGDNRRRRGPIPACDQEQSSKRASHNHKIPGHRHSPSLLRISRFGFAHERDLGGSAHAESLARSRRYPPAQRALRRSSPSPFPRRLLPGRAESPGSNTMPCRSPVRRP